MLCCQVSILYTPHVVLWHLYQAFHLTKALSHLCCEIHLPDDLVQGVASQQALVPISSSCPLGGEQGISLSLRPESWLADGLLGKATPQESIETEWGQLKMLEPWSSRPWSGPTLGH